VDNSNNIHVGKHYRLITLATANQRTKQNITQNRQAYIRHYYVHRYIPDSSPFKREALIKFPSDACSICYPFTQHGTITEFDRYLEIVHKYSAQTSQKTADAYFELVYRSTSKDRSARTVLNNTACEKLEFLGHVVSKDGLLADPRKVEAIKNFGIPINAKQIRTFLGMTGYYARFIDHYQQKAAPMQALLRKRARFAWTDEQAKAFQALKDALITATVLAYPNKEHPFTLTTDASNIALGAVLTQWDPKKEREFVIAFASKALSPAEQNYDATDREALAVIWAIRKYNRYLHGRHFTVYTDHKALLSIITKLEPRGKRRARWVNELQQYDFTIGHIKGEKNFIADALSRDPNYGIYED